MQIGIVGLPNVGKSTLFNALTKSGAAEAANYPFCTIDPNVGVVEVPDERIDALAKIVEPEKTVPAVVEFVDIAGLVKGASEGEGLGNKFLGNIRECDAIAQVVRVFENDDITHVHNKIAPADDIEVIEMELIFADQATMEKKLATAKKDSRGNPKEGKAKVEFYERLVEALENGKKASSVEVAESEEIFLKECHLLTTKPFLYIANVNEDELASFNADEYRAKLGISSDDQVVPICAKLEEDLAEMDEEDAQMFLDDLEITETGRTQLIRSAYTLLGLETYFTAGVQEVRAWTYKKGWSAPQCAGVIHTDFEKGFICADVVNWKDFVDGPNWSGAKEKGAVKMQGRDYVMQDGDVCLFKFNN
jgi:GTP-binding protein YchF